MVSYGKNSCVLIGNCKEVKVAQWSLNVLICPSFPPVVIAHWFDSSCFFQFSNNPLGLVSNLSKWKHSRSPYGLWWGKEKSYPGEMSN